MHSQTGQYKLSKFGQVPRAVSAALLLLAAVMTLPASAASNALYDELGRAPVVTDLADAFVDYISMDPRTAHFFDGVSSATLKQEFGNHLCAISDGPCVATGPTSIKGFAYSAGARVASDNDINVLNEYLSQAMLVRHIDDAAQKELLLRLNSAGPMLVGK